MEDDKELRLVPWVAAAPKKMTDPRPSVRVVLDSIVTLLDQVECWDDDRLGEHQVELEAAEEALCSIVYVGECERRVGPALCLRDTLAGSHFCSRHQ